MARKQVHTIHIDVEMTIDQQKQERGRFISDEVKIFFSSREKLDELLALVVDAALPPDVSRDCLLDVRVRRIESVRYGTDDDR